MYDNKGYEIVEKITIDVLKNLDRVYTTRKIGFDIT